MSGYMRVHMRLRRTFGPAKTRTCPCGAQAREWAYISSPNEQIDPANGLRYSDDLSDYKALCKPCHERFDKPVITHCPHGHAYVDSNILIEKGTHRVCKTCKYAAYRARYARKRAVS